VVNASQPIRDGSQDKHLYALRASVRLNPHILQQVLSNRRGSLDAPDLSKSVKPHILAQATDHHGGPVVW
jgi:hypothetical protein